MLETEAPLRTPKGALGFKPGIRATRIFTGLLILGALSALLLSFYVTSGLFTTVLLGVAGLGFVLLCLWEYRIGLLTLLVTMPVGLIGSWNFGFVRKTLAMGVVGLWFIWRLLKKEDHERFFSDPFFGFVVLFLGVTALSTYWAGMEINSWFRNTACFYALLFVLKEEMKTKSVVFLVVLVTVAMAGEAAYGVIQFAAATPSITAGNFRVRGTVEHSNIYGKFVGMGLLYVTGLFMLLRQTAARWALAGAAVVLSLGFILSFSRGAYMSLAVGLVFFIPMALQWRIRKVILVVLAVAYVAVNALIVFDAWPPPPDKTLDLQAYSLLFPATQGRLGIKELMQKRFQDDAGRDAIWETARRAFHEHPVFGSGFHKASQTMAGAVRMDYKEWIGLIGESQDNGFFIDSFPHPHNFILHVLVELGLVGLVLMLLCYYFLFKRAREQLARLPAGPGRILVLLGTAYLVADLFHGVFEPANIFGSDSTWYAYLFNVALVLWGDGVAPEPALPAGFQAWEPDEKM